METKEKLKWIFTEAIRSVNSAILVKEHMNNVQREFDRGKYNNILVIGFGKAAYQMACAVEEIIDRGLITEGVAITKYGHAMKDVKVMEDAELCRIKVFEAGHPIPDENGIKATERVIDTIKVADERTLVLCLISGGGSALFVKPYDGISLKDKQKVTELIMNAGADITELNSVRKHISMVKGGRLAEIAYPAGVTSLIISDVIGDSLDVIASGPTSPDNTTYSEALNVIDKYDLINKVPGSVLDLLNTGREGLVPETPGVEAPVFINVHNIIIGNNQMALEAARDAAELSGFSAEIISSVISGEARDVGKWLSEKAKGIKAERKCLISGGETTVTVKGRGKGGRNTELALSFAMEIEGLEGISMLSGGTDGQDGPTDAAGAIVDGETVKRARELGLDPEWYIHNNDSYNFFRQTGSLLITGPTGTNVMDLQIILIK